MATTDSKTAKSADRIRLPDPRGVNPTRCRNTTNCSKPEPPETWLFTSATQRPPWWKLTDRS